MDARTIVEVLTVGLAGVTNSPTKQSDRPLTDREWTNSLSYPGNFTPGMSAHHFATIPVMGQFYPDITGAIALHNDKPRIAKDLLANTC